jgi:hypothetical protein
MIYFIGFFLSTLYRNFTFFKLIFTHLYLAIIVVSGVFLGMFVYENIDSITSVKDIYTGLTLVQEEATDTT